MVVAVVLGVRLAAVLGERHQPDHGGGVEHLARGVLLDGVVDGRLQPGLVEDEVGLGDAAPSP